jgi:hypothetical protein
MIQKDRKRQRKIEKDEETKGNTKKYRKRQRKIENDSGS